MRSPVSPRERFPATTQSSGYWEQQIASRSRGSQFFENIERVTSIRKQGHQPHGVAGIVTGSSPGEGSPSQPPLAFEPALVNCSTPLREPKSMRCSAMSLMCRQDRYPPTFREQRQALSPLPSAFVYASCPSTLTGSTAEPRHFHL